MSNSLKVIMEQWSWCHQVICVEGNDVWINMPSGAESLSVMLSCCGAFDLLRNQFDWGHLISCATETKNKKLNFVPRLTFRSIIHYAIIFTCVWKRD